MFIRLQMMIAALSLTVSAVAQQPPPKEPQPESAKPGDARPLGAVLPSAALRCGADLEGAAPAPFLKWARDFAKRQLSEKSSPPAEGLVTQAMNANFAAASPAARQSGEALVWYVAYQQGNRNLETSGQRVQDIERDMKFLQDDLQRLHKIPVPMTQLDQLRAAEENVLLRLQSAERLREMYKNSLEKTRAHVDLCVERLAALRETVKEHGPAELRELKLARR